MNRWLKIILSIPRTICFNFRYFPVQEAIYLPVWIAPNVRIRNMWRGGIKLTTIKTGIVRIGYHVADVVDSYNGHTIVDIRHDGFVKCLNDVHVGQGAILCVKSQAKLRLGKNFAISGTTKIVCSKCITIGSDVQFSWDTLVMDSDAHFIIDESGKELPNTSPIYIGDNVWIAAQTTILKGTIVGNNCVVAGNSLLNRPYHSDNVIIGGIPAKIIKHIGGWRI